MKTEINLEEDKMIVTGPVLIPDKDIYRDATFCEGECMISFNSDTILEMSKLFLRGDIDSKQTIQHMLPTDDAQLIESWVISDSEKDKSVALGMNLPEGTWMATYQITDKDLWDSIKSGGLNGFSIEASAVDFLELSSQTEYATEEEIAEFYKYLISKSELIH